ncbi:hypothetical protein B0H12DRAFT_622039 [Mycena haematopus]|nr:hypothetical protein B0H12DRAFT_622039 [Mycena haematopus]
MASSGVTRRRAFQFISFRLGGVSRAREALKLVRPRETDLERSVALLLGWVGAGCVAFPSGSRIRRPRPRHLCGVRTPDGASRIVVSFLGMPPNRNRGFLSVFSETGVYLH